MTQQPKDLLARTKELAAKLKGVGQQLTRPWQSGDSLLEMKRTVLDKALDEVVPIGEGKRLFPFGTVRVLMRPLDAAQEVQLRAGLTHEFQDELSAALSRELKAAGTINHHVALDLELEAPGRAPEDPTFEVSFLHEKILSTDGGSESPTAPVGPSEDELPAGGDRPPLEMAPVVPARPAALQLTLVAGSAERSNYEFVADRIYLGRMRDVFDQHGRLRRRNHVAFGEDGEENATVSREHAQIRFNHDSFDYWLLDDRSAYGTRIFRDGRPIDVSSRDRRGIRIQSGDQIYLGRAVLEVQIDPARRPRQGLANSA